MSSKSKKVNPCRDPEYKAVREKAYKNGKEAGFELGARTFLDMALYTFNDLDMPDEWLERFHERFMSAWDSRVKGYISEADVLEVIKDERNWEVQFIGE